MPHVQIAVCAVLPEDLRADNASQQTPANSGNFGSISCTSISQFWPWIAKYLFQLLRPPWNSELWKEITSILRAHRKEVGNRREAKRISLRICRQGRVLPRKQKTGPGYCRDFYFRADFHVNRDGKKAWVLGTSAHGSWWWMLGHCPEAVPKWEQTHISRLLVTWRKATCGSGKWTEHHLVLEGRHIIRNWVWRRTKAELWVWKSLTKCIKWKVLSPGGVFLASPKSPSFYKILVFNALWLSDKTEEIWVNHSFQSP